MPLIKYPVLIDLLNSFTSLNIEKLKLEITEIFFYDEIKEEEKNELDFFNLLVNLSELELESLDIFNLLFSNISKKIKLLPLK